VVIARKGEIDDVTTLALAFNERIRIAPTISTFAKVLYRKSSRSLKNRKLTSETKARSAYKFLQSPTLSALDTNADILNTTALR
jgi:hypothetical protein